MANTSLIEYAGAELRHAIETGDTSAMTYFGFYLYKHSEESERAKNLFKTLPQFIKSLIQPTANGLNKAKKNPRTRVYE